MPPEPAPCDPQRILEVLARHQVQCVVSLETQLRDNPDAWLIAIDRKSRFCSVTVLG
jgi:hypothetical protein